jgi:hypothetical protein
LVQEASLKALRRLLRHATAGLRIAKIKRQEAGSAGITPKKSSRKTGTHEAWAYLKSRP